MRNASFLLVTSVVTVILSSASAQTPPAPRKNLIPAGTIESADKKPNKWDGVTTANSIQVPTWDPKGVMTVSKQGSMDSGTALGIGTGAADFTGDGILDLVLVDSEGYFWFLKGLGPPEDPAAPSQPKPVAPGAAPAAPNTPAKAPATPAAPGAKGPTGVAEAKPGPAAPVVPVFVGPPTFGTPEIIPLYLPDPAEAKKGMAWRMHVTDFNADGLFDLVLGSVEGRVYFVKNSGTKDLPKFTQPLDVASFRDVKLGKDAQPWFNFAAPCYADINDDRIPDLIVGDGTYASNNIYYYPNTGTAAAPKFDDRKTLILGKGAMHLTPVVGDLNGDGKPDILCCERDGFVTFYAGLGVESSEPKFAEGVRVKFGTNEKVADAGTLSLVDWNGDKLLDVLVGRATGRVGIALNKGTKEAPVFDAVNEIKGVRFLPDIAIPRDFRLDNPFDAIGVSLGSVTSDPADKLSFVQDFLFPPDIKSKRALRIFFAKPFRDVFKTVSAQVGQDGIYKLYLPNMPLKLKPEVKYELTFWVMGSGVSEGEVAIKSLSPEDISSGKKVSEEKLTTFSPGSSWSKVSKKIELKNTANPENKEAFEVSLNLNFSLQGVSSELYIDELSVTQDSP
jgi:hypothetical protein